MQIKELGLETLMELLRKYDLTELSVREGKYAIELKREPTKVPFAFQTLPGIDYIPTHTAGVPTPFAPTPTTPVISDPPPAEAHQNLHEVKAPLVGTFYRAPSPDAEPFVEEGDFVKSNDKLCIIEAMKIMNEIECPVRGIVKEICAKNGQAIEFGQVLFRIEEKDGHG